MMLILVMVLQIVLIQRYNGNLAGSTFFYHLIGHEQSRQISLDGDLPHEQTFSGETAAVPNDPIASDTKSRNSTSACRSATVLGVAMGYGVSTLKEFVGSLRRSGFQGHIILGVAEDVSPDVLDYLKSRKVTVKVLLNANCTFAPWYDGNETILAPLRQQQPHAYQALTNCVGPYTDIKSRWVKFPLARDWLEECKTCTGPVMITDVRDVYFQGNPFGPDSPEIKGLQVFEEHKNVTTENWLVNLLVQECKNVTFERPMLCSGTTIGTRDAIMDYLTVMYEEMKVWISTDKCRFFTIGDDQTIHNWLFYSGKLANAVAVTNREGIVNTIGFEAALIYGAHIKRWAAQNVSEVDALYHKELDGATNKSWIGVHYGLTDEDGFFLNNDGSRSRVIHQFDRIGTGGFQRWRTKQDTLQD